MILNIIIIIYITFIIIIILLIPYVWCNKMKDQAYPLQLSVTHPSRVRTQQCAWWLARYRPSDKGLQYPGHTITQGRVGLSHFGPDSGSSQWVQGPLFLRALSRFHLKNHRTLAAKPGLKKDEKIEWSINQDWMQCSLIPSGGDIVITTAMRFLPPLSSILIITGQRILTR